MTLRSIILTLVLISTYNAQAKVRLIHIDQSLNRAKSIKKIFIIGYNDSMMLYKLLNSNDTLRIYCQTKKESESFREILMVRKLITKTDLTGKWPNIGQQVLIVVDSINEVSLFAIKSGNNYRFWDPSSTPYSNSVFIIPKEKPYKPLEICTDWDPDKNDNYWRCTDGCLVEADASNIKEHD